MKFKKSKKEFVFSEAKDALDKLSEVSKGKNFKIDIQPYPGIKMESNFLITEVDDIWYLRICSK